MVYCEILSQFNFSSLTLQSLLCQFRQTDR